MKKLLIILLLLSLVNLHADEIRYGIMNQHAPSWGVKEWFHLPDGKKSIDIEEFTGKVVYLYCFQSWCPGCLSNGFPTLVKLKKHYRNDTDVVFIAIQTTFEGFYFNTFSKAKETLKRFNLDIPVGQSGSRENRSQVMRKYRTGGTPWTVIIDRDGVVRYNDFHINHNDAISIINNLKK